jgi:hypothetical protein
MAPQLNYAARRANEISGVHSKQGCRLAGKSLTRQTSTRCLTSSFARPCALTAGFHCCTATVARCPCPQRRPIAIAALEELVQRATVAVVNAIYERDFLGFSYGFRPGCGQHAALDALVVAITSKKVNYILDADIRSFFDSVSQSWLERFLGHRIADPRIIRLIQKWLKAGVLEDGGQGSVISPLLANVYLHYTFDLWAERWRRREATGDLIIVRHADDLCRRFRARARRPALLGRNARAAAGVLAGAASGKDPPDRVWSLCGGTARSARGWQTRNLQFPRVSVLSAERHVGAGSSSRGSPG